MPFRLHRSLFFTFGLLGLAVLVFAWRDSMRRDSFLIVQRQGARLTLENGFGHLRAGIVMDSAIPPGLDSHARREKIAYEPEWRDAFQPLAWQAPELGGMIFRELAVPHWLALAVYLPAWFALLLWRRRRARRGIAAAIGD